MKPILMVHGYSTEGKDNTPDKIYGDLPAQLRKWLGAREVREIDLSRWISLNDGITLDDVSFAMDRALRCDHPDLFKSGFNVIIHSTGALVARNWIRRFSPRPGPVCNLVHLAGANFGSGLAHIGQGQLARWGRSLFLGTDCGYRILDELELGSSDTLDLHTYFLKDGTRMLEDYGVREYCIIGSQVPPAMRLMPIRYVKEDSSDSTVRTAAGNLNFNHVVISPRDRAFNLTAEKNASLVEKRLKGHRIVDTNYYISGMSLSGDARRTPVPFAVVFETSHSGEKTGIVSGKENRGEVMPLVKAALETPPDHDSYLAAGKLFAKAHASTFKRAAVLKKQFTDWEPRKQYEAHAQLIFRIRDQNGAPVEHFDIYLRSRPSAQAETRLETLIEDKHLNRKTAGIITFYLRTQRFKNSRWTDLLKNAAPLDLEITGHEPLTGDITYLPANIRLTPENLRSMVKGFQTTVFDVTLVRLPSGNVFDVEQVRY
ncbi:MAG: hypothetical protein B5M56_06160 [Desulfococcus sp. 4484_241]|nr:MAG: hypothetical protein B5M56_06160 [Desulfococcus sp. 4484_241]